MNVFFEESGSFKAGAVLSRQGDAFQVELPGGRRAKVRGKDVLIEFEQPSAAELIAQADAAAQDIDLDFLWEISPSEEFTFGALANEYFGGTPSPIEKSALVLRLHGSPIYFRRKGRGQYQRAPEDQVKMALAALERRRQQALVQQQYEQDLKAGRLPEAFAGKTLALLTRPDKNSIEYKAFEAASLATGKSMAQLMLDVGGIESPRALHEARFLSEFFPHGIGFPGIEPGLPPDDLPDAAEGVRAFSIDDVTTTEIDDAFSVQRFADGRVRIGVHIAAPALGIERGDAADAIARARLSTVYMPGDKITMLPDSLVDTFTLKEGGMRPALSLYVLVDQNQEIVASETVAERVFVANNLRHNDLESIVTEEALVSGSGDYPHKDDIAVLWPFANALYEKRQHARLGYGLKREVQRNIDYNFYVDGERVTITPRRRGSPLDLIVAELAILANSRWGAFLNEHGVPGIYRAQRAFGPNRTRMQTSPAPHEGLGVPQYAWSTSPLRRYVDLVNQWQLLACVRHGITAKLAAPFKPKDADLYAVVQNFDETYTAYADHQRRMEYFWCLRWLRQEQRDRVVASVVKGDVVRLDEIPLLLHVPALGVHARGTKLLLEVMSIDELSVEASVRLIQVLDAPRAAGADSEGDSEGESEGDENGDSETGGEAPQAATDGEHANDGAQQGECVAAGAAEAGHAAPADSDSASHAAGASPDAADGVSGAPLQGDAQSVRQH